MAIVSFWGPKPGHGSVTSTVISTAAMIALQLKQSKTVITSYSNTNLDTYLVKKAKYSFQEQAFKDNGVDALRRLAKSNRLSTDMIEDYTTTLIKGNLDLLEGSHLPQSEDNHTYMQQIIQATKRNYDLMFLDIQHSDPHAEELLKISDLIIVCLDQNAHFLEQFFSGKTWLPPSDKLFQYVVNPYDNRSRLTVKNINRTYSQETKFHTIPYCSEFRDACNNSAAITFMLKGQNFRKNHPSFPFISAINKFANEILNVLSLDNKKGEAS